MPRRRRKQSSETRAESPVPSSGDAVVDWMKAHNIPLTRSNYLNLAFWGDPPDELDGEQKADLPRGLLPD